MRNLIATVVLMLPAMSIAGGYDVYVLGEVHDNPTHHAEQAKWVAEIAPRAVVYEMLTEEQAVKVTPDLIDDPSALEAQLGWSQSGWPDFSMYYPIFVAANDAQTFGAEVPREAARQVMSKSVDEIFGVQAVIYGLAEPLGAQEQSAREALQMAAHCDALPESMLPTMVDIQRLRDASLARAVVTAMQATGGPVAVITGNGHTRRDWGVPAVLARAAPALTVFALGQGEEGRAPPEGGFDELVFAPAIAREDPCDAFQ